MKRVFNYYHLEIVVLFLLDFVTKVAIGRIVSVTEVSSLVASVSSGLVLSSNHYHCLIKTFISYFNLISVFED